MRNPEWCFQYGCQKVFTDRLMSKMMKLVRPIRSDFRKLNIADAIVCTKYIDNLGFALMKTQ